MNNDTHTYMVASSLDQAKDLCLQIRESPVHSLSWPLELPDGSVILAVYNEHLAKTYEYVCIQLDKREIIELFQNHYPLDVPLIIVHELKGWLRFFSNANGPTFDSPSFRCTRLLAYLYDPPEKAEEESEADLTLEALVRKYCHAVYPFWGVWLKPYGYPEGLYRRLWEDARYTYDLWHRLLDELDPAHDNEFLNLYHDIELPMARILLKMELQGVRVDQTGALATLDKLTDELVSLREEIESLIDSWVNPNSSNQVKPFFAWLLGEPFVGAINDEALEDMEELHPAVAPMLRYRQASRSATFFNLVAQSENSRVYPKYHQCRVATGRISVTDPALQNIQRDLRQAHLLPEPGHYLVEADYGQAEARMLAYFSGDPRLVEILQDDARDVFTEMAEYFSEATELKANLTRDQAKTLFYSVTYGVSGPTLATRLRIDEPLASALISAFKYDLFHEVGEFIYSLRERFVKKGRKGRFQQTPWGRRRMFDRRLMPLHALDGPQTKEPTRDPEIRRALNFLLQGSVADLIKQAQIRIDQVFAENSMDSRVILNLHDGLWLSVPPDEFEVTEAIVRDAMEQPDALSKLRDAEGHFISLPLRVEVKILQQPPP